MLLSILPLNNWIWVLKHRSCTRCIMGHVLTGYGNQRIYHWMTSSSALVFSLCCYLAWRKYFNAISNKFFDINFWSWAQLLNLYILTVSEGKDTYIGFIKWSCASSSCYQYKCIIYKLAGTSNLILLDTFLERAHKLNSAGYIHMRAKEMCRYIRTTTAISQWLHCQLKSIETL